MNLANQERGFSLVEVMISIVVLTIGLVSLLGVFGLSMASTQDSQQNMIAKQLANEELESIVTARNTAQIQWDQIMNVNDGGIFINGYQPIYIAGPDGIFGTADDAATGQYVTLQEPGPDGVYNNGDDVRIPLRNYQRKVEITAVTDNNNNVVPSLRNINITIQYNTPQTKATKTYVLTSFISQFR